MIWKKQNETQVLEVLGEGLTSRVYKAIRKHDALNVQQVVALKVLHSKNQIQSLKNEIELLLSIDSPYCVKLLGWEQTSKGLGIVLEYLDGVLLEDLKRHQSLSRLEINEIIYQVQEGLKALHLKGIVHGDVSYKNIFITKEGGIKIIDFGFSSKEYQKCDYGTPQCMSIEAWSGAPLVKGSDLYSLGLLREGLLENRNSSSLTTIDWRTRAEYFKDSNSLMAEKPESRSFLKLESNKKVMALLSEKVQEISLWKKNDQHTEKVRSLFREKSSSEPLLRKILVLSLSFFASLTLSASDFRLQTIDEAENQTYNLDIRSKKWADAKLLKINHQRHVLYQSGYAPVVFKSLPKGEYELRWATLEKSGTMKLSIDNDKKVIIDQKHTM